MPEEPRRLPFVMRVAAEHFDVDDEPELETLLVRERVALTGVLGTTTNGRDVRLGDLGVER